MALPTRTNFPPDIPLPDDDEFEGGLEQCDGCGNMLSFADCRRGMSRCHNCAVGPTGPAIDDEQVDEDNMQPSPGVMSPPLPGQLNTPRINSYGETNSPSNVHEGYSITEFEVDALIAEATKVDIPPRPSLIDIIADDLEPSLDSNQIMDQIADDC